MKTVKVWFSNLGSFADVALNAETEKVLRNLYFDSGVYTCGRRSDEDVLLRNRVGGGSK